MDELCKRNGVRFLSQQTIHAWVSQLEISDEVREVVACVSSSIKTIHEDAVVFAYGSAANGFEGSSSDIDISIWIPSMSTPDPKTVLKDLRTVIDSNSDFTFESEISDAKVPIVKYAFQFSDRFRNVDLSCNNILPLFNTMLIAKYSKVCSSLPRLAEEVRDWAKQFNLHGASDRFENIIKKQSTLQPTQSFTM